MSTYRNIEFPGHAYLFTGTWAEWQPRISEFLSSISQPDRMIFQRLDGASWRIAELRGIIAWAALRPYASIRKVGILDAVERFTPEAGDAFLKTLEEPPPSTLFFLFTRFPRALTPTLRSRLIEVTESFVPPRAAEGVSEKFLRLARLPLSGRLEHSARRSGDPALEGELHEWLLVLRTLLLENKSPFGTRQTLRLMTRLLGLFRVLRETSAQPRLAIDSFLTLW